MNGNGNGKRNRVTADGFQTRDTFAYCYAVSQEGLMLYPDRCLVDEDGDRTRFVYVWNDVPKDGLVIRVTLFKEGRGYWSPVRLPLVQSDEMLRTTKALLRLHNLSLQTGLGLKKATTRWGIR